MCLENIRNEQNKNPGEHGDANVPYWTLNKDWTFFFFNNGWWFFIGWCSCCIWYGHDLGG